MVDAKWVYTWKTYEQGWIVKAKSRLVAHGFKQREGIYFGETFALIVSSSCVRLMTAIACELDLNLCHFNVSQALFNLTSMRMFFCVCRKVAANCLVEEFDATKVCMV